MKTKAMIAVFAICAAVAAADAASFSGATQTGFGAGSGRVHVAAAFGVFAPMTVNTDLTAEGFINTDTGDPIDIEKGLGADPNDIILSPEVVVSVLNIGLRVKYDFTLLEASTVLKENITFDGETFGVSDEIDYEIQETQLKIFAEYTFLDIDLVFAKLSVTLGAGGNMPYARQTMIDASDPTKRGEIAETDTIPVIAAEAALNFLFLEASVRVEGMQTGDERTWDALGGVTLLFPPTQFWVRGGAFLGIRYSVVNFNKEDFKDFTSEKTGIVARVHAEFNI